MNKLILVAIALLTISNLFAQDVSEVFNSSKTKMVFVGLDFSKAKMVGSDGFNDPDKIQSYYFGAWNSLLISEMDKYDIKKAFMKREMDYDMGIVEKGNSEVDFVEMVTNKTPKSFTEDEIQGMVSAYDMDGAEADFGLSFIVHSFNKGEEKAHIYIVLFDVKSKKVLLSNRLSGEPRGFGFRNYWAGAISNIIDDIEDSKFRKWKKELEKS